MRFVRFDLSSPSPKHHRRQVASRFPLPALVATVTSLIALSLSVASAYMSYRFHVDSSGSQLIAETYATFYDLNKKQEESSEISHIFVAGADYKQTADRVALAIGPITPQERARYELKEKAAALHIFTVFEQNLYQYSSAREVGDSRRAEFLQAVLDYFTGRLLRNPRLQFYWSEQGGNLQQYFEKDTKRYYQKHLRGSKELPLLMPDPKGPYVLK